MRLEYNSHTIVSLVPESSVEWLRKSLREDLRIAQNLRTQAAKFSDAEKSRALKTSSYN
jgi:hypothetical protein